MALSTVTIKKDSVSLPIRLVAGVEFEYDSVAIENDIPSDLYSETDTWKTLVIPATDSGDPFEVEKEWVLNPSINPVTQLASYCAGILCKSKAPVAITNFKIEIWTYNDLNDTPLISTWVQTINALATTYVLNGASAIEQNLHINDLAVATRVKIKISGTPDANIEEDTDFLIYPDFYENVSFGEIASDIQPVSYAGLKNMTNKFKGLFRTKTIPRAIVKETDADIILDLVYRKDSIEVNSSKHIAKFLLVRPGTTASVVALSEGEKFQLKTEGYGNTDSGIEINKNDDGCVIEALVNYKGEVTFTVNVATAGWHSINLIDKDDMHNFQDVAVSFYVNAS